MTTAELFGWIASILTTLIFLPQLHKAFTTRMTNDISMLMLFLAFMGNAAWFIHASLTDNTPLVVCATLIMLMSVVLIIFKYRNERPANR